MNLKTTGLLSFPVIENRERREFRMSRLYPSGALQRKETGILVWKSGVRWWASARPHSPTSMWPEAQGSCGLLDERPGWCFDPAADHDVGRARVHPLVF